MRDMLNMLLPEYDPDEPNERTKKDVSLKPDWGTVQSNGRVLLDRDTVPLPATVDTLVPYLPGDRVYALKYGKRVVIAGKVGGGERAGTLLTGEDLNDYKTPGTWIQHSDGGADTGANYPFPGPYSAGLLEVHFASGGFVFQRYTQWQRGLVWARTFYSYENRWTPWELVSSPTGSVSLTIPAWAQNHNPVYATSLTFPRPFAPPPGYGFEAYLLASSGFTFLSTVHSGHGSATHVHVRVLQIASASLLTITVGWRLVKI